jgi:hypothetical protein
MAPWLVIEGRAAVVVPELALPRWLRCPLLVELSLLVRVFLFRHLSRPALADASEDAGRFGLSLWVSTRAAVCVCVCVFITLQGDDPVQRGGGGDLLLPPTRPHTL